MKKAIILGAVLLVVSGAAVAQVPPIGYIGLFTSDQHNSWCVTGAGFYSFEMWIWCLPGTDGQICAEFSLDYPANTITSTVTPNAALISVTLGDLDNGMSVCYRECQTGWHWNFHQTIFVTDASVTNITIEMHPDVDPPAYQFASCEPGYPIVPCIKFTNLQINTAQGTPSCQTAVATTSWGAIKDLFRD